MKMTIKQMLSALETELETADFKCGKYTVGYRDGLAEAIKLLRHRLEPKRMPKRSSSAKLHPLLVQIDPNLSWARKTTDKALAQRASKERELERVADKFRYQ